MRVALLIAVALAVGVSGGCAGSSPTASTSSPASPAAASPEPVDLTLPTTIHPGYATTGGAAFSTPSHEAKVSARRALAVNDLRPKARLTGTVLADVTMPNDFYHGRPIEDLTCWVYVFTAPKPFDPRIGGYVPGSASPSPSPAPMLVWHMIFILDAGNGQFVRGFFTR